MSAGQDSMVYVHDSLENETTELDTGDQMAMARFNRKYGFRSDSLYDIPKIRGVRTFTSQGVTIVVGSDPIAIATEVESLN
ncbi:MAG: hypothetical protein KUG49_00755 [Dokdonia sp.]|nr:hypothetical protein [Dokdonia sp.]